MRLTVTPRCTSLNTHIQMHTLSSAFTTACTQFITTKYNTQTHRDMYTRTYTSIHTLTYWRYYLVLACICSYVCVCLLQGVQTQRTKEVFRNEMARFRSARHAPQLHSRENYKINRWKSSVGSRNVREDAYARAKEKRIKLHAFLIHISRSIFFYDKLKRYIYLWNGKRWLCWQKKVLKIMRILRLYM